MSKDRARDSHVRLDPWMVYQRVMGIRGLTRVAFEQLQRSHFTYWYMERATPDTNENERRSTRT